MVKDPGTGVKDPGTGVTDPGKGVTDPGKGVKDPGKGVKDPGKGVKDPGKGVKDPGKGAPLRGRGVGRCALALLGSPGPLRSRGSPWSRARRRGARPSRGPRPPPCRRQAEQPVTERRADLGQVPLQDLGRRDARVGLGHDGAPGRRDGQNVALRVLEEAVDETDEAADVDACTCCRLRRAEG